jgi:hypothetical protein
MGQLSLYSDWRVHGKHEWKFCKLIPPCLFITVFTQYRKFNHAYATSSPFHHAKWKSFSFHSTEYWNLYLPDVISSPVIQQIICKLSFRAVTILYYWGRFLEQALDGKQPVPIQPSGGSNLPKVELSTCSWSYIRWEFNDCPEKPY